MLLGNFHQTKVIQACIGKYLRGSGIENILIETQTFGPGVVEQVLNGADYARCVKGFGLIGEALMRSQLEIFFEKENMDKYKDDFGLMTLLQETFAERNFEEARKVSNYFKTQSEDLICDFQEFIDRSCPESQLFHYWNSVILLIRLMRDWKSHLAIVKKLQPIFHVMDQTNYARWSAVYLHDMAELENNAPDVYLQFLNGHFSVKQTTVPFTSIGTDQGLEVTINRSTKSAAGVIGSTNDVPHFTSWDLTFHEMTGISTFVREIVGLHDENDELRLHHEFTNSEIRRSEEAVGKLVEQIKKYVHPFAGESQHLQNIVTRELVAEGTEKNYFRSKIENFQLFV